MLAGQIAGAAIPAMPVMTLYRFNSDLNLPYYDLKQFERGGATTPAGTPAGTLAQGTTLIPCLVVRDAVPVTDDKGTPFVGFEIVTDPRSATPDAAIRLREAMAKRQGLTVANHHCRGGVRHVIDSRNLYAMDKVPFFDPPGGGQGWAGPAANPDDIVRAFHNSPQCAQANVGLTGRRQALGQAWDAFASANRDALAANALVRARQLDFVMRTALFEAHLGRGCNAYGACERNIVALSVRNRALERCFSREGCRAVGDFEGVASTVSQYNIWDEYLTQISGLTACYLRDDLASRDYYARLQAMYVQNVRDMQRILFGTEGDLVELFPGASIDDIKRTAHYYHAPAMGKCFPQYKRVEYMSGAVARSGNDFALLINTRIQVGDPVVKDYQFRSFGFHEAETGDVVEIRDDYPGFLVDGRKVSLEPPAGCRPYGIPAGCAHGEPGRYRRTPMWLNAGKPVGLTCQIADRTEQCVGPATLVTVQVGAACDTQMRPVSGVH